MSDQSITRLRVEYANGQQATITAMRIRAGELLADYAIEVIAPGVDGAPAVSRFPLEQFPRGAGINRLLAIILSQIGSDNPAIDEQGQIVPLPAGPALSPEPAGQRIVIN